MRCFLFERISRERCMAGIIGKFVFNSYIDIVFFSVLDASKIYQCL